MNSILLNLGCGSKSIPGFTHIDLADYPHIDYKHDIKTLPMFKNNSVDLIYCCHALEYFDRQEAEEALKEWYRVLKKGGNLRLAVPDFKAITDVYQKYGDLGHIGILGPLYGRIKLGNKFIYHKTVYDLTSLRRLLKSVGFKEVEKYDWHKTIHRNYDDFSRAYVPHMDEKGILISLNVEAKK